MNFENENQLFAIKSAICKIHSQLQNSIALGVIAAGSDFDNHDKALTDNYWNILLEHLHQTNTICNETMEMLDLDPDV